MKSGLIFLTLLSIVCCTRIASGQTARPAYTDADAYEIYSLLLRRKEPADKVKPRRFVVQTETEDYPSLGDEEKSKCLAPAKGEEAIYSPVIESYHKANKDRWSLQPRFAESLSVEFVSEATLEAIFKKGSWEDFYKKYPKSGGYITMSAVGFNSDKTLAIVYVGSGCGGLCGAGSYRVLRKTAGNWTEIPWNGIACVWVS